MVSLFISPNTANVWLGILASVVVVGGGLLSVVRALNKMSKKFDTIDEVSTKVDSLTTQVTELKSDQDAMKKLVDKELQHNGGESIKDLAKSANQNSLDARVAAQDARQSANAAVAGLDQFTSASVAEHQLLWRAIYENRENSA